MRINLWFVVGGEVSDRYGSQTRYGTGWDDLFMSLLLAELVFRGWPATILVVNHMKKKF